MIGVRTAFFIQRYFFYLYEQITDIMTVAAIRTKLHRYIDEADIKVLELLYQLLEDYKQNNSSLLTEEQQKEILNRSELYKAGKGKAFSIPDARKFLKEK